MRSSASERPLLDSAVELSERHRAAVRSALQQGVHEALGHLLDALSAAARSKPAHRSTIARDGVSTFDEALIVIYRILFLLFAEARGLVPRWHPIFRDSYTIEALREPVELLSRPPGVWEALQAIARLAHRGCRIGSLRVPPFNGRLFSPAHAPLADSVPLDDGVVRRAVLALTTRRQSDGLERVAYGDLDVEQLGGVYERLLDFDPETRTRNSPRVHSDRRKATGAFYTPRPLTEYLVRRALGPLVNGATRMRFCLCAFSIRRWAAAPFSLPRAASWPTLMKRRWCARAGSRQRTLPTRNAPSFAAQSRNAASTASTSIRWRSSSDGCPSGWRPSRQTVP